MSKTGCHDVGLTPEQFYTCTGWQQWWLARRVLELAPGDGWRWSVADDCLLVEAVAGSPEVPFPEPPPLSGY